MILERLTSQTLIIASKQLARRHKELGEIVEQYGTPPLWARRPGFPTLLQIILEQQVSLVSARAAFLRLQRAIVPFTPERVLAMGETRLKNLGLTRQKTAYCLHLAEAIVSRRLRVSVLGRLNDADVRSQLTGLKGFGPWSADVYLLMALRRPDVWPASDVALATAVTDLRKLPSRPTTEELTAIAEAWRPLRSVAARMLWHYYLSRRRRN